MWQTLAVGLTTLIIPLLLGLDLHAQAFTPLSVTFVPASDVADPGDAAEEQLSISVSHLSLGAAYPVSFAQERTRLVNGLRYQQLGLSYHDGSLASPDPSTLHYLRYELTLIRQLSAQWTAAAYLAPGLASDFAGRITADDLHVRTFVLLTRRASSQLTYGLGVTYRNRLDNAWLPVVQLTALLGQHFRVQVVAPSYAQFWIAPRADRNLELGLQVRFSTTPFHLEDAVDGTTQRMQYKIVTGGAAARFHLMGPAYASLDAGLTLLHQLDFEGATSTRAVDLGGSPFVRGAVVIQTGF